LGNFILAVYYMQTSYLYVTVMAMQLVDAECLFSQD